MNVRIIVEKHIPFIEGSLEAAGCQVQYLAPNEITHETAMHADALIVRTRTRCDEALLAGTPVKLVATATIGTDHIDLDFCSRNGIEVANAPGCNAPAVAQYVMSSIARLSNRPLSQLTIGIIGVGHVGSIVDRWATTLDMRVLRNDPPRERAEGGEYVSLEQIAAEADVITIHTPLTHEGADATYHLIGKQFITSLRRSPIIINAARGGIVDEQALCSALDESRVTAAVIDCWENEPTISRALLSRAKIATPHIAGYSRQGKIRATAAALDAVSRHFGLPLEGFNAAQVQAEAPEACAPTVTVRSVHDSYNPFEDTAMLRTALSTDETGTFEHLRNTYTLRAEAPAGRID